MWINDFKNLIAFKRLNINLVLNFQSSRLSLLVISANLANVSMTVFYIFVKGKVICFLRF